MLVVDDMHGLICFDIDEDYNDCTETWRLSYNQMMKISSESTSIASIEVLGFVNTPTSKNCLLLIDKDDYKLKIIRIAQN